MNVIYCVSELTDWIDVAKYFQEKKSWKPSLWITTNKNYNYLKKSFPTVSTIDFFDANRGIFKNIPITKKIILSKELLSLYSKDETIALKMMDRMDPSGYNFNYSERIQLYYQTLEFVLNYFNDQQPKIIIFNETPHSIFTYIIYAVAKQQQIKILRLSPTHINGNVFLTSSLEKEQPFFKELFLDIQKSKTISEETKEYVDAINGKYDNAVPYYMDKIKKANNKGDLYKIIKMGLKSIEYLFRKEKQNYYKNKFSSIRKKFTNSSLALNNFKSTLFKIKLQKEYTKFVAQTADKFNLDEPFIYFPLQYQPEKSSSPEADIYVNQYLAINMLSKLSDNRFKIYVKEHISQFSITLKGEQGRALSFYESLATLDNIVFIDTDIDSFLLIDKAISLATLTGTAGLESIIRGKPSIIFGYPWYKECEGIFHVENLEKLKDILDTIYTKEYTIELENIMFFIEAIFNISQTIYLNPSNSSSISDTQHNNVDEIIQLIETYEDKVV